MVLSIFTSLIQTYNPREANCGKVNARPEEVEAALDWFIIAAGPATELARALYRSHSPRRNKTC
jgi:hypothetical protein